MLDGRVAGACLVASLATATRLEGVAILPALALIRFWGRGWRVGRADLWFLVTPLGLLSYMAYLQARWGDPFLFLKVHAIFGRGLRNPFLTLLGPLWSGVFLTDPLILATYAMVAGLILATFARVDCPVVVYGWLLLLIPLTSGVYLSIYRVHLVNMVVYLAIGLGLRGRWRWLGWGIVGVFTLFQWRMMFEWSIGYFLP